MKAVMYHYVRPVAPDLPHFPYLSLADFDAAAGLFRRRLWFREP